MPPAPHSRLTASFDVAASSLPWALLAVAVLAVACSDDEAAPSNTTSTASSGGSGGTGGGGADGGSDACLGECGAPTPFCDELLRDCVACLEDTDCTSPSAAKCNAGECVPCDASAQCAGIAGTEVCDTTAGTCVECALNEEAACDGGVGETCDLLAHECVAVGPETVLNCNACTNDAQCAAGHRCIPMDFEGSFHGIIVSQSRRLDVRSPSRFQSTSRASAGPPPKTTAASRKTSQPARRSACSSTIGSAAAPTACAAPLSNPKWPSRAPSAVRSD